MAPPLHDPHSPLKQRTWLLSFKTKMEARKLCYAIIYRLDRSQDNYFGIRPLRINELSGYWSSRKSVRVRARARARVRVRVGPRS